MDEDVALFEDNCKGKVCKCDWNVVMKCKECPRQMFTTDIVCQEWRKWVDRKNKDKTTNESLNKKADKAKDAMRKVSIDEAFKDIDKEEPSPMEVDETNNISDPNFAIPSLPDDRKKITSYPKNLRSSSHHFSQDSENVKIKFPKIPLRFGRRSLNPKVMRAMVHCQTSYKVSDI